MKNAILKPTIAHISNRFPGIGYVKSYKVPPVCQTKRSKHLSLQSDHFLDHPNLSRSHLPGELQKLLLQDIFVSHFSVDLGPCYLAEMHKWLSGSWRPRSGWLQTTDLRLCCTSDFLNQKCHTHPPQKKRIPPEKLKRYSLHPNFTLLGLERSRCQGCLAKGTPDKNLCRQSRNKIPKQKKKRGAVGTIFFFTPGCYWSIRQKGCKGSIRSF